MVEFKEIREKIIREVFRDLTSKWDRHFVIYPLSPCDNIALMFSRFYFLLYEVESPLKLRHDRFIKKYEQQKEMTLEQFIDFSDKIQFNHADYSLYTNISER